MFTLQAKLIENAAASGSAKEMTQALANCNAPLEHRGPMANTYVGYDGGVPGGGFTYAPGTNIGGSQFMNLKFVTVNIPPWQNIPFTPTPLLDIPPWVGYPYDPPWYSGGDNPFSAGDPAFRVGGESRLGDTITKNLTTQNVNSQNIVNEGGIVNRQDIRNEGNSTFLGDTYHGGRVVNDQTTIHNGPTIHQGDVINNSPTYLGDTYIDGVLLGIGVISKEVVTDISYVDGSLEVTKEVVRVLAPASIPSTDTLC